MTPIAVEKDVGGSANVVVLRNARVGDVVTLDSRSTRSLRTGQASRRMRVWPATTPVREVVGLGLTDNTQLSAIVRSYADRVHAAWPEAEVWSMRDAADPSVMKAVVIAPTWDLELMSEVIDLSLMPEAENAGVCVDPSVYFADSVMPPLEGFSRLV